MVENQTISVVGTSFGEHMPKLDSVTLSKALQISKIIRMTLWVGRFDEARMFCITYERLFCVEYPSLKPI